MRSSLKESSVTTSPSPIPINVQSVAESLIANVEKVIVGKRAEVQLTVVGLLCQGHLLIEDVPGVGKTMLAKALARSLGTTFNRIQFTPDMLPSDVTGVSIFSQRTQEFEFRPGPLMAQIVLTDEINRATPKTQAALLEAMEERQITVDGVTRPLPEPFMVLATQNPIEYEGTFPLPEAQLDRFLFKVNVDFPSSTDLVEIIARTTGGHTPSARKAADGPRMVAMGQLARQIPVASHVSEFVARLIVASHPDQASAPPMVKQFVRYGASPRGAQALILGAKITALFAGRLNVAFEDVAAVAPAALRHRLLLNFEGQAEGVTTDDVVKELLKDVSVTAK